MLSFLIAFCVGFFLPLCAQGNVCRSLFADAPPSLGVHWTPYQTSSHKAPPVPEVLRDPYVIFAIQSDKFRLFALEHPELGLTDYKLLIDSVPQYTQTPHWQRPPESLSFYELAEYLKTKYRLRDHDQISFSPNERREVHPLLETSKSWTAQEKRVLQKIQSTWEFLLRDSSNSERTTLLQVPNPYVVAGGRFRESYYWDSFWIMKGLLQSGYGSTAKGMLENFVHLYETYGNIPNGNRYYYLTRTQPPFFMEMVMLLKEQGQLDFARAKNPTSLEARLLSVAKDYYRKIWKGTPRYQSRWGLFRYHDGAGGHVHPQQRVIRPEAGLKEPRSRELHSQRVFAESGWDMSYSRFGRDPQNWLPVDLNLLLYGYTHKLSQLLQQTGNRIESQWFEKEAQTLRRNIQRHLWDAESQWYRDFHFEHQKLSTVTTAASFFPYYFEIYPKNSQSRESLQRLLAHLKPEGHRAVHTTDRPGEGQWDGEWSWAPLNEMAFQALKKYELTQEAKSLAKDYSQMVMDRFDQEGGLFFEKYHARDGSVRLPQDTEIYGNEEGFGWTNATLSLFLSY